MSNTTHEAPERIWATMVDSDCARSGTFVDLKEYPTKPNYDATEYVRADLVQAAVAAALREAAQAIQGDEMLSPIGAHRVSARILTLITEDAQAALDRVVAEAVKPYRIALADAIRRPMGVVPASAEELVTTAELDAAEQRRSAIRKGGE